MIRFHPIYPIAFAIVLCSLFIASCHHGAKDEKQETTRSAETSAPYPAMSNEEITRLYVQAEKVDMIFYNLPMSVNQEDAKSAKNTVLYISPAAPVITNHCKPLGRLTWISQGQIIKEADIYSEKGCEYFLFMQENKPVAANAMAESGITFFNQILTQAAQQRPQ